ncbi:hypothetical protein [Roseicitreum antarcticum]|uniref:Uncharacterized protein n=1 Tax=Roseicitreum antarcticum TaxID=564137 RepID=A0A1H3A4I4_9RHOB|nr:hypothetical protein [Roseicitreum antarcticum]SDX24617.1 hypothetical protein SAMN04488238_106202 [Roseicitreum antarcticum]
MTDTQNYGAHPQVVNIEKDTLENPNFRTTRWTGSNIQVTLMTIPTGGDIGREMHENSDQFLRLEQDKGRVQMGPGSDGAGFRWGRVQMRPAEDQGDFDKEVGSDRSAICAANAKIPTA